MGTRVAENGSESVDESAGQMLEESVVTVVERA